MRALLQRRAILVTGKGGVGKTTLAAAIAHLGARSGKRVLVAEVSYEPDATSPLARALGLERLSEEPKAIAPSLKAVLLTPTSGHVRFLRATLPVKRLADAALRAAAIRRFLLAAPTLAEMGILYRILDLVNEKRADGSFENELVVVDLPATGHAMGLAQIPSAILEVIRSGPIATATREGIALLKDPSRTTSVVVTLPETLPVSEAMELVQSIQHSAIPFSGVVLNRMPEDPFVAAEREAVDAWVQGKALLGARSLPRIDRARHAEARLRQLRVPVMSVGELATSGHVAPSLADALGSFS
ncbi:MAG: ArsA family ATPase [Deltaproteobacteria bacterium]|nr:ArsA family ATPase [Deltaproteobacteria bacterium]